MRLSLAAGSVLALVVAHSARADVVELKDGRRMERTFKGASPAIVALDVGVAALVRGGGQRLRTVQNGYVRSYALWVALGVVGLLVYFLSRGL